MAVYRFTKSSIERIPETTFPASGIKERGDLQRLLRANIGVVAPDVLVISEEFAEWEDSKRRIDLLGLDKNANLVIIELKRDDDGGHMELQAIRYAAMVSSMTFARAVDVYQPFLDKAGTGESARSKLLDFLEWEEPREDEFASDARIVLVAADFSKEITTAVLWLNERDLDIRCVRLKPYSLHGEIVVDVQQVVPLPEAEEYTVQLKNKTQAERQHKAERNSLRIAFWKDLLEEAAEITPRFAGLTPGDDCWIGATAGYSGLRFVYMAWQHDSGVELYIDGGGNSEQQNKRIFDRLLEHRSQIEAEFGGPLSWERLDGKRASRIRFGELSGGVCSPREDWPKIRTNMIKSMVRFEKALEPHLSKATT